MIPTKEQIGAVAYDRWLGRGGGLVRDWRDWIEAELGLLFELNYSVCVKFKLGVPKRQFIGSMQGRKCRYCGRSGDTTFRNVSHAVPEAFGNKSLISLDECDSCNTLFSESFEHDFDNFTRPIRTPLGIKGKRIPSFKTKDERGRIDFDGEHQRFTIQERGQQVVATRDEENKKIEFSLECQPYRPIGVYRCLVKMALAMMPMQEMRHFDTTRRWLLNEQITTPVPARGWAKAAYLFSPIRFPEAWAALHRRRTGDAEVPYMVFLYNDPQQS